MKKVVVVACLCAAVGGPALAQDLFAGNATPAAAQRTLSFAKVGARIPAGSPWAKIQADDPPFPCRTREVATWDAKSNQSVQDAELDRVFREEIARAGMRVAGDPTNLFEGDSKTAELQVGALITAIDASFCLKSSLKEAFAGGSYSRVSGSADLAIEWQIYSTLEARVVGRVQTSAKYVLKEGVVGGDDVILRGAFAENVKLLAANADFRAGLAVAGVSAAPAASTSIVPISFAAVPVRPVAMNAAVRSVVSIFAGEGHGSGVLISSDGYILTNHHVAGGAGRVRVRWADGTDTVGEVVRSDRRRDVALIKTVPRAQPLSLRATPALLGETVFAIGTPLDKELSGTVTKGVISSNRVLDGQPWIQSDTPVTHGNSGGPLLDEKGAVLGLTAWGRLDDNGQAVNLNFFVPIDDAMKVLALKPN